MFLPLGMMAPDIGVTTGAFIDAPVPAFSATPTVASTARGVCALPRNGIVLTPAALRVSWALSPSYAGVYVANVYEDGMLVLANTTATQYDKVVAGQVENGINGIEANWTYRVDIVRITTGDVVATATAPLWGMVYGDCASRRELY